VIDDDPQKQGGEPGDEDVVEESTKDAAADAGGEAEQPKRKPRRRKKAESKADEAEDAKAEGAEEEAEAAEAGGEAEGEPPADAEGEAKQDEKGRTRRRRSGSPDVAAAKKRTSPARRTPEGDIMVRAQAKYVRCAPRKARLVVDHIRGKSVDRARAILLTTPRAASRDVLKLLDSAIANAENNHELVADELVVGRVFVDEGPTLKRYRPRALGRATRIHKRTSHMTIELTTPKTTNGKQG